MREQVGLLEKVGYQSAMLGERHMYSDGFLELQSTLAAVVTLTRSLRICAGVLAYPLYDPLHIAEYTATLDVVSGGRLDFGVGLGSLDEMRALGLSTDAAGDRLDEALKITRKLWKGNMTDFNGRFYQYRNVFVRPTPIQKPHPPILIGGRVRQALRRAAKLGDGWLVSPAETLKEAKEKSEFYRNELRKRNRTGRIVVIREAYVARSRERATAIVESPISSMYHVYSSLKDRKAQNSDDYLDFRRGVDDLAFVVGSPDDCIGAIEKLSRELETQEFCLRFQLPGVSQDEALSAIRLWSEKVQTIENTRLNSN